MKYYNYHKLIKSDDNDRDNEIYIGKYGEDLRFMKHEGDEGDYFFYCLTLNLYDFYISQKSKMILRAILCKLRNSFLAFPNA